MGAAPILTIQKDGETIRAVPIEGDALVGRDEGCVIRLEDRMISRQHALFRRRGNQIQVEKKSEFAPLLVNGADCTQAVLKEGDVIAIGPYMMKLTLQQQGQQHYQSPAMSAPSSSPAQALQLAAEPVALSSAPSDDIHLPALEAEPLRLEPGTPDLGNAEAPALDLGEPLGLQGDGSTAPLSGQEFSADALEPVSDSSSEAPADLQPEGGVLAFEPPQVQEEGEATRVMSSAGPELRLVFKPGDANVVEFKIEKDEIFIGRGKDCDIILTDKKVSRKNTVITRSGFNLTIKDLGSSNGTYVNGEKVTEKALNSGDKIKIGGAEFNYLAEQPGYTEQAKDFLVVPPLEERSAPIELPPFQLESAGLAMAAPAADAMGLPAPAFVPMPTAGAAVGAIPGVVGSPGSDSIAGIAGIAGVNAGKKKSFMERFRALPKQKQWLVIGLVICFGYFFFLDDDPDTDVPNAKQAQMKKGKASKKKKPGDAAATADNGDAPKMARPFSALSKERQEFVRTQHKLAFEYFQHQDYANALAAIKPIFEYVDDFEDSREIQRYAEDGIRQMKIIAEEKAKKEAEEAKIRKITELLNRARGEMEKKHYTEASSIFNDILVIDPENAQVAQWQAKIREHEEELKIEAQKRQVQAEVNTQAWTVYKEGLALHRRGELRKALSVLVKVKEIGAVDARPARLAAEQIKTIHAEIQEKVDPLLKSGKEKEDSQDYVGAMADYSSALKIEPGSADASKGVSRIKGILTDRAKALYTEAVLAESYSDFATAKKKFQQCSETAPKDSVYHERAIRKLARYFKQDDMGMNVPQ
jgi:pSer/pThr/pTyr-binding forkhead associated (FHA) protein